MNSISTGREVAQYNGHVRSTRFAELQKNREEKTKNGGWGKSWRRYSANLRFHCVY